VNCPYGARESALGCPPSIEMEELGLVPSVLKGRPLKSGLPFYVKNPLKLISQGVKLKK
jgi:hypothetical protein